MKHILSRMSILSLIILGMFITAFAPVDQAVKMELRLKKGQKFKHWVLNDQTIIQSVQGRETKILQQIGNGYAFEVINVNDDSYDLRLNNYRVLFDQKIQGLAEMDNHYDSTEKIDGEISPIGVPFKAQLDKGYEFTIDKKANVSEIRGVEAYVQSVYKAIVEMAPEMDLPDTRENLAKTLTEENLKSVLTQLFVALPQNAISTGEIWEEEKSIKNLINMYSYLNMEVESIDAKAVKIKLEGDMESEEEAKMNMGGTELEVGLGGTFMGSHSFELKSGLLKQADYKIELLGEISAQGMSVPMAINTKTTITLEK